MREIDNAISKLKRGKDSGPDNIPPEHLIFAQPTSRQVIFILLNLFMLQSYIHASLKVGLITPIFKCGGKDPIHQRNYRGITPTPTLSTDPNFWIHWLS